MQQTKRWYALRVSYGRTLKFVAQLKELGVTSYVPMCTKKVQKNGKETTVTAPAITNLCFAHATKSTLEEIFNGMGENRYAHFMWDRSAREPIIVSDKAMADFIQVSTLMSDDVLYLKDITSKLQEGQRVRVIDGPFKGVEGTILRIKRSRRIVVELPGLLAVATNYVDPRLLEVI